MQTAPGPELARAEVDHRLDHVERGRVGGRLRAAGLADDHVHLGEAAEDHVAGVQVVASPAIEDIRGTVIGMSITMPSSSGVDELARQRRHPLPGREPGEQ